MPKMSKALRTTIKPNPIKRIQNIILKTKKTREKLQIISKIGVAKNQLKF